MTTPLPPPDATIKIRDGNGRLIFGYTADHLTAYGNARAAAERAACIAICDLEASKSLEMGDLEAYYGTSAYAISNAIKARGTT